MRGRDLRWIGDWLLARLIFLTAAALIARR